MHSKYRPMSGARGPWLIVVLFLLTACGASSDSVDGMLARAEKSWQGGDVNAALIELKNASQAHPEALGPRRRLAELYLRLDNLPAAEKELDKAIDRGLPERDARIFQIKLDLLKGDADVALATLDTDPVLDGGAGLEALRGDILVRQGRLDEAFDQYSKALENEPDAAAALAGLARIHGARGELAAAQQYVARALEADPRDYRTWMLDAQIKARGGDTEAAHESLRKAVHWNPSSLLPRLAVVRLLIDEKKYDAALAALGRLRKQAPKNPAVQYYTGVAHYLAEDFDQAEDAFREVLSMVPGHPPSQLYMGFLTYRQGNLEQAEEYLDLYRDRYPDFLPAQKLLAAIQIKRAKPDEALTTLSELGGDADAEALGLRASAYFETGNAEAAINTLKAAAELAPDNAPIETALFLGQSRLGNVDEAIAMLEPRIHLEDKLTRRGSLLLYGYLSQGKWDEAIAAGKAMQEKIGDDPALLNALGTAYVAKNDREHAEAVFERALELSPDTPSILRNLIMVELNAGEVDRAKQRLPRLLELSEDDDTSTLTLAGMMAELDGDWDSAVDYYERARRSNPRALEARVRLSSYYLGAGDYDKAVQAAAEALEVAPRNLNALINLGHGLRSKGELEAARNVADGTLEMFPDSPKSHFLAGYVALESGHAEDAETHLRKADELLPDNPDVLHLLAKAVLANKDERGDLDDIMARLVAVEGESARVHALRGDIASDAGEDAAAARHYAAAVEAGGNTAYDIKLAFALAKSGRPDEAVAELEHLIEARPKNADLRFSLGQLYERIGRTDAAAKAYRAQLELDPDAVVALNNLAWIELERGSDEAVELAQRAYELAPQVPDVAHTYGWVMIERGQLEAGLKALKTALDERPNDGEMNFHYAVALARSGNRQQAREVLDHALAMGDFASRDQAEMLSAQLSR